MGRGRSKGAGMAARTPETVRLTTLTGQREVPFDRAVAWARHIDDGAVNLTDEQKLDRINASIEGYKFDNLEQLRNMETKTGGNTEVKGRVTFAEMMSVKPEIKITADKVLTFIRPVGRGDEVYTSKKSELNEMLKGSKTAVINFYNDRSGARDLQRMKDLGFKVVAQYTPENNPNSSIPARHYYYMRRR